MLYASTLLTSLCVQKNKNHQCWSSSGRMHAVTSNYEPPCPFPHIRGVYACVYVRAAVLHALQLRVCLRLLPLQPVRGVQRPRRRLRGPGTPPLAAAGARPVPPGRRDGHDRGGHTLPHDLQAPGPRRYLDVIIIIIIILS